LVFRGAYNMANPYGGFTPEAAFTGAAERFFELLKTFGAPAAGAAARPADWSSLAGPLAGQFEQWLRASQAGGPWFGAPAVSAAGFGAGAAGWPFGPLPLGPGAAPAPEAQRTFELLSRLAQLQGQMAAHWSEIANTAARNFVARLGAPPAVPGTPADALRLYESWVECAEEVYAATVRKDDFCRLQAELANTAAALLVEQRRHAETLVRAFGLPTRKEMDALYGQLKELRAQVAQLQAPRPAASGAGAAARPARAGGGKARRTAKSRRSRPRT